MSFADVVGHEPVIRLLKGQLAKGHLAHTVLLVGPEGIGKRTLAVEFAKALHCADPKEGDSCGQCEACRKIAEGTYPDVRQMIPESEGRQIGIDQIRAMGNWAALTPHSGQWKVAILDPVDRLTEEAANACLKVLEEPPARTLFLLLATGVHRLPTTLVSRCHQIRCFPQGVDRVASYLRDKEELEPPIAQMLAVSCGGRLGLALQFHRTDLLKARNSALDQMLTARQKGELEIPLGKAPREEIVESLEWYAGWWRDLLVLALQGESDWVIHQDRIEELKRAGVGQKQSIPELIRQVERAYWVQEAVQKNASARMALSVLLNRG